MAAGTSAAVGTSAGTAAERRALAVSVAGAAAAAAEDAAASGGAAEAAVAEGTPPGWAARLGTAGASTALGWSLMARASLRPGCATAAADRIAAAEGRTAPVSGRSGGAPPTAPRSSSTGAAMGARAPVPARGGAASVGAFFGEAEAKAKANSFGSTTSFAAAGGFAPGPRGEVPRASGRWSVRRARWGGVQAERGPPPPPHRVWGACAVNCGPRRPAQASRGSVPPHSARATSRTRREGRG